MWLLSVVVFVFAIHSTWSWAPPRDVCIGAKERYGVFYNNHPYDCSMFVQCFPRGDGLPMRSVYRKCDFGEFWDYHRVSCFPSHLVDCPHDRCRYNQSVAFKHHDPNKCGAFWKCENGRAYANCCPLGQGFHVTKGCIDQASCKSVCPLLDRVPGCKRRPLSGAPTHFEQFTDNGKWFRDRCPPGAAFNPADCTCSITGVIKAGRICRPDIVLNFDDGTIRDTSGNGNIVRARGVRVKNGEAYFGGRSKIMISPLKKSAYDEGVLIIKMKYRERNDKSLPLQAMFTNGHCTHKSASVLIAKQRHYVLIGSDSKEKTSKRSTARIFSLPTIKKTWKEVIYIKDNYKLEGRVCGASLNHWAVGDLVDHGCGYQIGMAKGMRGYIGVLDDISIYRCKPLDAVINMNY